MLKTAVLLCVFAVLASSIPADAQTSNQRTLFTFNQPFSLPGVTLPAGTYEFRIVDDTTSRRVVNVLDGEGQTSYALLLTVPAEREVAPGGPAVQLMETLEGLPPAVQAWWYPGSRVGYEFVYPRWQAERLATATAVLTTADASAQTMSEMREARLARISSSE